MEAFVHTHNYPFVTEYEAHNFRHLSSLRKVMVVAVVQVRIRWTKRGRSDEATRAPIHAYLFFKFSHTSRPPLSSYSTFPSISPSSPAPLPSP